MNIVWKEAHPVYEHSFIEAMEIIEDCLANGFNFKWENGKLYYQDTTQDPQKISDIFNFDIAKCS